MDTFDKGKINKIVGYMSTLSNDIMSIEQKRKVLQEKTGSVLWNRNNILNLMM